MNKPIFKIVWHHVKNIGTLVTLIATIVAMFVSVMDLQGRLSKQVHEDTYVMSKISESFANKFKEMEKQYNENMLAMKGEYDNELDDIREDYNGKLITLQQLLLNHYMQKSMPFEKPSRKKLEKFSLSTKENDDRPKLIMEPIVENRKPMDENIDPIAKRSRVKTEPQLMQIPVQQMDIGGFRDEFRNKNK